MKLVAKIIVGILTFTTLTVVINSYPTWVLQTSDMNKIEGEWVNVYYENEKDAAEDVFEFADSETKEIADRLGFEEKQNINVYIYDYQQTMQTKKYGYIAPVLGLDWYIGDNIGTDVILTSPANPGKVHDYNTNKYVVLHEITHAYVSVLNSNIDLWLTEGMALYLSNGESFYKEYLNHMPIPTYEEIGTKNPVKFSNMGGYDFAHTYIEFLDITYGWDKVLELISDEDYQMTFGKPGREVYDEWVDFLEDYYQ